MSPIFLHDPRFEIIRHDVVNPILLEVDQIYNFACPASPVHYQYNPVKTVKTNVMGTHQHAGARQARPGAHPAGVNVGSVWRRQGASAEGIYWGNVNPIGPRSCYDEGKRWPKP